MSNKLLGQIIYWDVPKEVEASQFGEAMENAGFGKYVPSLTSKTAFSRAVRKFNTKRIIKSLRSKKSPGYQFTQEFSDDDGFYKYNKETGVFFDPATANITAPDKPELAEEVQSHYKHCLKYYSGSDVSKALYNVMNDGNGIFQLRPRSPIFFFPRFGHESEEKFLDALTSVFKTIAGNFNRIDVPNNPTSTKAIQEAIHTGFMQMVSTLNQSIDELDPRSTSPQAMKKAGERIQAIQMKAKIYSEYLGDLQSQIDTALQTSRINLRDKIEALSSSI